MIKTVHVRLLVQSSGAMGTVPIPSRSRQGPGHGGFDRPGRDGREKSFSDGKPSRPRAAATGQQQRPARWRCRLAALARECPLDPFANSFTEIYLGPCRFKYLARDGIQLGK